jgi:pantoate--beta-alanine ligase
MKIAETIARMRQAVAQARAAGEAVGLVPTMGALHEGHFSLIEAARTETDFVVVSIFVNPLQFGPAEDLSAYPRTPGADVAACEARGVDVVFLPPVEAMYPREGLTEVRVAKLGEGLCGRSRPGHFPGVCTVVAKLFNIVQPDRAYFGQKDFQQGVILRRMAEDLDFPIEIVMCPTAREADGLAVSSRNHYLTEEQRRAAPALYGALKLAERLIRRDRPPAAQVVAAVGDYLAEHVPEGDVDYIEAVDAESLSGVDATDGRVLIALAVKLGRARLIDNMVVDGGASGS